MTLELHTFYSINCIDLLYTVTINIDLSVCSLLILKMLHRYNHGNVTCSQSWVLPPKKTTFFSACKNIYLPTTKCYAIANLHCGLRWSTDTGLRKCGLEFLIFFFFTVSIVPVVKNSHRIGPPLYAHVYILNSTTLL